jgi:hypothetical protein
MPSKLEKLFEEAVLKPLLGDKIVHIKREYRFAAEHVGLGPGLDERLKAAEMRDWRFDYAVPSHAVAIEIDGGVEAGKSRHTSPKGYVADQYKLNAATADLNWQVIHFTGGMLRADPGYCMRRLANALQIELA